MTVSCLNSLTKKKIKVHIENFDKFLKLGYISSNGRMDSLFCYNSHTTVNQLFLFLVKQMFEYDYDVHENYSMWFKIKVSDEYWFVQKNYNFNDFIINNNLDTLYIRCLYASGGGEYLCDINASIYINSNEGKHKNTPHVHVYRGHKKVGPCARICLTNLTYMEGETLDKLFSKKVAEIIFDLLRKYQDSLIDYYRKVQLGMLPLPIYMDFRKRKICFC